MKIFKYPISVRPRQVLIMPSGALLLAVQMQAETACIWAAVDPLNSNVDRIIYTRGTGHDLDERLAGSYLGTYQEGPFVWHVFDGGISNTGSGE